MVFKHKQSVRAVGSCRPQKGSFHVQSMHMRCGHSCPCSWNIKKSTSFQNGHIHRQESPEASSRRQDLVVSAVGIPGYDHATDLHHSCPSEIQLNQSKDAEATRAIQVHIVRLSVLSGSVIFQVEPGRLQVAKGSHYSVQITIASEELEELVVLDTSI